MTTLPSAALRRQAAKLLLLAELNPAHPQTGAIVVLRLNEVISVLQRCMGSIGEDALAAYAPAEGCDERPDLDIPDLELLDDGYADGLVITEAFLHSDSGRLAAVLPHMNPVDVAVSLGKLLAELMHEVHFCDHAQCMREWALDASRRTS